MDNRRGFYFPPHCWFGGYFFSTTPLPFYRLRFACLILPVPYNLAAFVRLLRSESNMLDAG